MTHRAYGLYQTLYGIGISQGVRHRLPGTLEPCTCDTNRLQASVVVQITEGPACQHGDPLPGPDEFDNRFGNPNFDDTTGRYTGGLQYVFDDRVATARVQDQRLLSQFPDDYSPDFWFYVLRAAVSWVGINFLFDRILSD